MAEPTLWEPWSLPTLDGDDLAPAGANAKSKPPKADSKELTDNESIETVEGWGEEQDQSADAVESVEELSEPEIHLPSAEELEAIRKAVEVEAYAEGFAKGENHGRESGYNQAYQEAQSRIEHHLASLAQLTNALVNPIEQQDQAIEQVLLNSVVTIAQAVIGRELESQPQHIKGLVQQSMAALPSGETACQIFVNPQDLQFIQEQASANSHWDLIADEEISRGGCRISTDVSQLDATIEQRTKIAIDQFLAKQLASGQSDGSDASATESEDLEPLEAKTPPIDSASTDPETDADDPI